MPEGAAEGYRLGVGVEGGEALVEDHKLCALEERPGEEEPSADAREAGAEDREREKARAIPLQKKHCVQYRQVEPEEAALREGEEGEGEGGEAAVAVGKDRGGSLAAGGGGDGGGGGSDGKEAGVGDAGKPGTQGL